MWHIDWELSNKRKLKTRKDQTGGAEEVAKIVTQREGITDMKKILGTTVALAVLAIFISSAQAAIKIETAWVQNGVAYIQGNGDS